MRGKTGGNKRTPERTEVAAISLPVSTRMQAVAGLRECGGDGQEPWPPCGFVRAMITLQRTGVRTGTEDRDGYLVLEEGDLAGVIVRLDDPAHGDHVGKWFLEACFGPHCGRDPVFASLDDAVNWFHDRKAGRA